MTVSLIFQKNGGGGTEKNPFPFLFLNLLKVIILTFFIQMFSKVSQTGQRQFWKSFGERTHVASRHSKEPADLPHH